MYKQLLLENSTIQYELHTDSCSTIYKLLMVHQHTYDQGNICHNADNYNSVLKPGYTLRFYPISNNLLLHSYILTKIILKPTIFYSRGEVPSEIMKHDTKSYHLSYRRCEHDHHICLISTHQFKFT